MEPPIFSKYPRNFSFGGLYTKDICAGFAGGQEFHLLRVLHLVANSVGVEWFAAMAMRAVKLLGENRAPTLVTVRHFTGSRTFGVAGAPGSGTEGTEDMDSGEREAEGLENPQDVKQREDDGRTDRDEEELQGKPVAQVGIEKVRDNLAGSSS